ncbi:hypothetical protein Poli38472_000495 [Pythium oligandrum]|uniref:Lytic polysaccharide monooxygenase n=1 Tax=Pythium oligandrum TaxID=41045 RepID=A0A8K1CCF6_PYTOL|nr:hypothetical protein Poli38472_000495 [Pythium oligandrum]|eukprot:TMW60453.1 hypothetical protein Poli38472_000495 [Pythium oligandrum]
MKLASVASIAALALGASQVDAHSWLVKPVSRETAPQVDMDGTIGCPNKNPGQSTSFQAGESIDVSWWRNNHIGGFIRWAIIPKGQEESGANFDKNVFYYTCRESGESCKPNMPGKPYKKDGAPGDNSRYSWDYTDAHKIPCGDKIKLPDWLAKGDYVLQWTWFGAGSSFDNFGWAEVTYRSCADIKITTDGTKSKPTCPTFVGGDRVTKNENMTADQCFYYSPNNYIPKGQLKQDNNNYQQYYKFGKPQAVVECQGSTSGNDADDATPAPSASGDDDDVDETSTPSVTPTVTTSAPKTTTPVTTPSQTTQAPATTAPPTSDDDDDSTPAPSSSRRHHGRRPNKTVEQRSNDVEEDSATADAPVKCRPRY